MSIETHQPDVPRHRRVVLKPFADLDGPVEKECFIQRIKIAAEALEIPEDAVEDMCKHGTRRTGKACQHLVKFAHEYGVSLDWLISGDIAPTFKSAAVLRARV